MDRLKALEVFKSIVEHGSFVKGAEALGISRSVATRAVQDLEAHLRVRLLQRTTRRIALTVVGHNVLEQACGLIDQFRAMEAMSSLSGTEVAGSVRLVAPASYGRQMLGPALADFRSTYPGVSVDLRLVDDCVDVIDDEADLSICVGRGLRLSLIARKIGVARLGLYASSSYLVRNGAPEHPFDLQRHDCLTCHGIPHWQFKHRHTQETHAASPRGVLNSNSVDTLIAAAIHGAGIVLLPCFLADRFVDAGELQSILEGWQAASLDVHLAYSSRQHQPLRVRKLIDHLSDAISSLDDAASSLSDPHRSKAAIRLSHSGSVAGLGVGRGERISPRSSDGARQGSG
ncbi:LysR family transcriptional regulator [Piscinibacter sp. XHJ-5]|uniref:LysR family transcriptional regulator n=1 Tax=Piscinibacter sp. XHJ-5 TaxID=3037797 RepID=UPI0024535300|nr:LysR family transcriptional regulator [Piscinibacter sp. XHJ-5]